MRFAAFYEGRKIELEAETALKAKVAAADLFKARKRYNVAIVPCNEAVTRVLTMPLNMV
jgi:hypothetical protein